MCEHANTYREQSLDKHEMQSVFTSWTFETAHM